MKNPGEVSGVQQTKEELLALAQSVIIRDAEAVSSLSSQIGSSFWDAMQMLLNTRGKVFVSGSGTSGATAKRIAHLLSVGGTPSLFLHPTDSLHGSLGAVVQGDTIIAISKGGETDELNDFVRRCKARGAQTICITGDSLGTLARLSEVVLLIRVSTEADPSGMIAMGSALAACAIGDALVVTLMEARAYSWEKFAEIHPGGAVGKLLQQQQESGQKPTPWSGDLSAYNTSEAKE